MALVHHLDMPIMRQTGFHISPGTENQIAITPTLLATTKVRNVYIFEIKMGFSNLCDSGICAMNNFELWRQISLLLFVVCF